MNFLSINQKVSDFSCVFIHVAFFRNSEYLEIDRYLTFLQLPGHVSMSFNDGKPTASFELFG